MCVDLEMESQENRPQRRPLRASSLSTAAPTQWLSSACFLRIINLNPLFCPQSLVLITKLPYVTFFHSLLKIMAPEYFEKQEPCLEAGTLLLLLFVFVCFPLS